MTKLNITEHIISRVIPCQQVTPGTKETPASKGRKGTEAVLVPLVLTETPDLKGFRAQRGPKGIPASQERVGPKKELKESLGSDHQGYQGRRAARGSQGAGDYQGLRVGVTV